MNVSLKLDWCSHDAAKYAVQHWHYSKSLPAGKIVKIGVWEDGKFIGAVIFGLGAQQNLGRMFGLTMFQCCELCRVALAHDHKTPVSRIVAIALRMLKKQCPGDRAVISYADCDQGHHGGIYAAGGWTYLGLVQTNGGTAKFLVRVKPSDRTRTLMHGRSVHAKWGSGSQTLEWLRAHVDPGATKVFTAGKHKYIFPLDEGMRQLVGPLAVPYPKRAVSTASSAPGHQPGEDGEAPITALQIRP